MAGSPVRRARRQASPTGDNGAALANSQGISFAPQRHTPAVPISEADINQAGELARSAFAEFVRDEMPVMMQSLRELLYHPMVALDTKAKLSLQILRDAERLRILEPVVAEAHLISADYIDTE